MDVLRLIGIGMIICLTCVILRSHNAEFAILISLVGGFLMLAAIMGYLKEIVDYFNGIIAQLNVPSQGVIILVKCLGLSYLAKICCDTCVDCGETSTATKIELAAKIGMLFTAMPLMEQLLEVIVQFSG